MNDEIKGILKCMKYSGSTTELALLDYITNLQQEIEKKDVYIKYLHEYNPQYYKGKKFYGDSKEELQQRIDKAIEYIEHSNYDIIGRVCSFTKLLNILQGNSND